jgi:DNA replication and repair protein RecF
VSICPARCNRMYLESLRLNHFRNYLKHELTFGDKTTVLVGENGVGKTNVLEAVYLLATGESFRAGKIEEMVNWEAEVGHVAGEVSTSPELSMTNDQVSNNVETSNAKNSTKLTVTVTRGMVQGKKFTGRRYLVDGTPKRKQDFVGQLLVVAFRPEDMDLLTGQRGGRRGFLDGVLVQTNREYRRSLMAYEKALRRRNRLLDLIRDGQTQRSALAFWDQVLIKEGEKIYEERQDLVRFINLTAHVGDALRVEYLPSVISESRLAQYAEAEVAVGYTLVGPHRDDFFIATSNRLQATGQKDMNLAVYGSRGEQRMAVLWLKLAELQFIEEQTRERPVLLLDDIFSELDDKHDKMVMEILGKQQTIVSTTDEDGRFGNSGVEIQHLS